MTTTFETYLHEVLVQAEQEARDEGSATIEAQHLLLAIAAQREGRTHEILAAAGIDHRAIRDALDRELEHSLSMVGLARAASALPPPTAGTSPPKMSASAKLAVERAVATVARKDLRPAHLLLGVLEAEVGTVPRALAIAGIDRVDLRTRALRALTPEAE